MKAFCRKGANHSKDISKKVMMTKKIKREAFVFLIDFMVVF